MSGEVKIKTGSYPIDAQTWFDVRLTDMGVAVSLCDMQTNTRYTILAEDGHVAFGEVSKLIRDREDGRDPYTPPGYVPDDPFNE
jgi:hypothetical protein